MSHIKTYLSASKRSGAARVTLRVFPMIADSMAALAFVSIGAAS
jgi:hypothetical protein